MDLAESDERSGWIAGHGLGKQLPVASNCLPVVGSGKAKVQVAGRVFNAIGAAQSALAGAEGMPKPGGNLSSRVLPECNLQQIQAVRSNSWNRRRVRQFFWDIALAPRATGYSGRLAAKISDQSCGLK